MPIELILALVVFVAFGVGAMTGFGSIVLALSVGALFFDLASLVIILVPLTLVMNIPLAWLNRKHINWPILLRIILPAMVLGTAVGYFVPQLVPERWLKVGFAGFILILSLQSLVTINGVPAYLQRLLQRSPQSTQRPITDKVRSVLIGLAGVIHGMYATGGPLLVYALARSALNKSAFRASLVMVWLTLNSSLTVAFLVDGRLDQFGYELMVLAPFVALGATVGNWLHHRVDEAKFLQVVYGLLIVVSIILLVQSI